MDERYPHNNCSIISSCSARAAPNNQASAWLGKAVRIRINPRHRRRNTIANRLYYTNDASVACSLQTTFLQQSGRCYRGRVVQVVRFVRTNVDVPELLEANERWQRGCQGRWNSRILSLPCAHIEQGNHSSLLVTPWRREVHCLAQQCLNLCCVIFVPALLETP